jgi:DNA invertase Pin-like site-specific DNA recombinase
MKYGYGRVSTNAQDTALQEDALRRAGVDQVITEKWSGVGLRPRLQALLLALRAGDELVVYKLDRLGRSLQDLLAILDRIAATGAHFRSLTEPIDTTTPAGKLMFSILGAVAEFERSLIRQRSIAGQMAARSRGKHCGRPRSSTPDVDATVLRLWRSRWYTMGTIADVVGLHPSTVKRIIYRVERPGSSSLR